MIHFVGGKTQSEKTDVGDKGMFLEKLISTLKLKSPVIISPSMSGSYSLPYLFKDPSAVKQRSRGFVPVAPVHTKEFTPEQYKNLPVSFQIDQLMTPMGLLQRDV